MWRSAITLDLICPAAYCCIYDCSRPRSGPGFRRPRSGSGPGFTRPRSGSGFMRPRSSLGFTCPGSGPGFTRPVSDPGFTRPGSGPGFTRPGSSPGFTRPGSGPGFTRPGSGPGFTHPGWLRPQLHASWLAPTPASLVLAAYCCIYDCSRPRSGPGFRRPLSGSGPGFTRPGSGPGFTRPGFGPGFTRPSSGPGFTRPGSSPGFTCPGWLRPRLHSSWLAPTPATYLAASSSGCPAEVTPDGSGLELSHSAPIMMSCTLMYTFAPSGEAPSHRVGHTCLYVPDPDTQGKGKVVIVGGADPSRCYSDAHIINLDTYEWINPDWKDLLPCYEHACFTYFSDPTRIWVFGGAEQAENRNSIQVISPEALSWKNPNVEGPCPSPRTFHTSSSTIGDKFYVFGGGEKGAEPAADDKLHVFDTGNPPKPRHGHTITAVGSKLFIHGGMAGSSFFSDLFCIDTDTMTWEQLRTKGEPPPPCAAHSSVCWKNFIYIFGGMTETGPISTMYRFDTGMQANANESSKLE
ncbi:hypothetical protein GDO78_006275 [Eleutherodactylus coqui]|uniref:Rab9 effector protein with kelch motifs n=1 Tax=Eleutherodactylus coqui TaxID=57060 RepID=A0A8J6FPX8_ELECQ|nr:hypothetical protein GDO78_006275 [Eleutherodactylus coqui]